MSPTTPPSNKQSKVIPTASSPSRSPSPEHPPTLLPTKQPTPTALPEEHTKSPSATENERVIINWEIFDQLLGLDDEDDATRAFSKGTVQDYFEQALQKFKKMDEALAKGHLEEVTDEAHSLKGSSAAIALSQVEATFGEIDRFREKAKAWEAKDKLPEEEASEKRIAADTIKALLIRAKKENAAGKVWMEEWYETDTGTRETF